MAKKNLSSDKQGKSPSTNVLTTANSDEKVKELTEEERRDQFEKFQPSGEFEKDFLELTSILDLPVVINHRPKLPVQPPVAPEITSRGDKKNPNNNTLYETEKLSDSNIALPTTFVVSNDREYFKARIGIETESENKAHVKELYLRGWLAEIRVMDIFSKVCPYLEKLTVLDLWHAGLTNETMIFLIDCLKSPPSSSLKTLNLDGNPIAGQRYDTLILPDEKLCLQNLSLRNCEIDAIGASYLASALIENTNLLTLNLCYNKLCDQGAKHIAEGLCLNRTLLSLNVGSNEIGDIGVRYIAEALSTFPLSHEQIVARRYLRSAYDNDDQDEHKGKKGFGKSPAKKNDLATKKLERTSSKKGKKGKSGSKSDRSDSPSLDNEILEVGNPLLEKVRYLNGDLWIPGNRTLIYMNLSRNEITEGGLGKLYSAMQYQVDLAAQQNRITGGGLMKLNVHKNRFSANDSTYALLEELMKKRDPFYKPVIDNCEEEINGPH